MKCAAGSDKLHIFYFERTVENTDERNDAFVVVIERIENERSGSDSTIMRLRGPADLDAGGGNFLHNGIQEFLRAFARFRRDPENAFFGHAEKIGGRRNDVFDMRRGEIDLVHGRDDRKPRLLRRAEIRERLRLDAFRSVDQKNRPFNSRRARGKLHKKNRNAPACRSD